MRGRGKGAVRYGMVRYGTDRQTARLIGKSLPGGPSGPSRLRGTKSAFSNCIVTRPQTQIQYIVLTLNTQLPSRHLPLLHHRRVLLLEPLVQPARALQRLVHAAHHTALLARHQRFGREVVDAVVEAALDQLGVHLLRVSQSGPAPSVRRSAPS